jgi:hypothetical protein
MRVEIYVAGVSKETWFRDTKDQRQVSVLNCLDRQAHDGLKIKQTFDYTPSVDEVEAIDIDKLDGATLVLGIEEIKPTNGGRLKFRGKIDRSSLPKGALRSTNGAQGAVNTPAAQK